MGQCFLALILSHELLPVACLIRSVSSILSSIPTSTTGCSAASMVGLFSEVRRDFQLETKARIDETQQDQIQSILADSDPVKPILDPHDSAAWQPVTEEPLSIYVKEEQPSNNVYFNIS